MTSGGERQWTKGFDTEVQERAVSREAIEALQALYLQLAQTLHTAHHALKIAENALWEAWQAKIAPGTEEPPYLKAHRESWQVLATEIQQRIWPDVLQHHNEAQMTLVFLDRREWELETSNGLTSLDYDAWLAQKHGPAEDSTDAEG